MSTTIPLSTLLSYALVAFTTEFDNEFEHQLSEQGPAPLFLTSYVMWANFMRFVSADGISVRDLTARAAVSTHPAHPALPGMERWGYVRVEPTGSRLDRIVRPTAIGDRALSIWTPLPEVIEERWNARFATVAELRASLGAVVDEFDTGFPYALPVVSQSMRTELPESERGARPDLGLGALLSRAVLAFTLDFETRLKLSLPHAANVVRVLESDAALRDVPRRSGVSKEAISMALTFLSKREYVVVAADPSSPRSKVASLTELGERAVRKYERTTAAVEAAWGEQLGATRVGALREALQAIVVDTQLADSPLRGGLVPYPGSWRAKVPEPECLPHQPMVLHRGGWPDGS